MTQLVSLMTSKHRYQFPIDGCVIAHACRLKDFLALFFFQRPMFKLRMHQNDMIWYIQLQTIFKLKNSFIL